VQEFAAIYSSGLLPKLGEDVSTPGGVKQWVLDGTFVPTMEPDNQLRLNRVPIFQYASAISRDYERFALSGLETYIVSLSEHREYGAAGWPLLKLYYSAFFSAHALLRSRGAGLVNFEKRHTDHINNVLHIYEGTGSDVSPGAYLVSKQNSTSSSSGEVNITFAPAPSKKGVHEAFWIMFSKFIVSEATKSITEKAPDSSVFLAYATQLSAAILEGHGNSSWLSKIRNQINYQHEHETWMPMRKSAESSRLSKFASQAPLLSASLDIPKSKRPLESFANICCYISNLNIEVANRVSKRSTKGRAFGQQWRRLNALLKVD